MRTPEARAQGRPASGTCDDEDQAGVGPVEGVWIELAGGVGVLVELVAGAVADDELIDGLLDEVLALKPP